MKTLKFKIWDTRVKEMVEDIDGQFDDLIIFRNGELILSDRFILLLFTGLKDKNNKEIYEGDIIRNRDGIWKVEYINHFAKFCMVAGNQIQDLDMCLRSNEVIGNIYENPKLLEK